MSSNLMETTNIFYKIRTFIIIRSIYSMENKICCKCKKEKSLNEFPFKNKEKEIYHSACIECWVDIRKTSYGKNKKTTIDRNKRNKKKGRDWYTEYKSTLKCVKCGENHPACLDFHHSDPTQKDIEVSKLIGSTFSIKYIMKEINKCEVLCANCHRKFHYNERQLIVI